MCTCGIDMATQQADAGDHQQGLKTAGDAGGAARGRRPVGRRRWPVIELASRRRSRKASGSMVDEAEDADAQIGRGASRWLAMACCRMRRPDGAGEVVAAGDDRDRDAAAAQEPVRDVGHQRPEGGRAAEHADQQRLGQDELRNSCRLRGGDDSRGRASRRRRSAAAGCRSGRPAGPSARRRGRSRPWSRCRAARRRRGRRRTPPGSSAARRPPTTGRRRRWC